MITASIIIPTKNAGNYFERVLDRIFEQEYGGDLEVIVIDSGSTDDTVSVAHKYGCTVFPISPDEFHHGKTRNYGAKLAKGDIIVFITQDALPSTDSWLSNLLRNFNNPRNVGVYGRQIPIGGANPMEQFFYSENYPNKRRVWTSDNYAQEDVIYSSVNSAIRKDIFQECPFSEKIIVSEDYDWAYKVLSKKYNIVYDPKASVIHSHNYDIITTFRRYFDIGVSYHQIYQNYNLPSFFKKGLVFHLREINFLLGNYPLWIPYAIIYDSLKFMGVLLGKYGAGLPKCIKRRISRQKHYWR